MSTSDLNLFSDAEFETLSKAYERLDQYVVIEDDFCYLTVNSAKDVNMSDRLFSLVEEGITSVNSRYEAYVALKDTYLAKFVENPFDIHYRVPLTRISNPESEMTVTYGANWSCHSTYLSHQDVTLVINAVRSSNGSTNLFGSSIAGLVVGGFPGAVGGFLVGAYSQLYDGKLSGIQNDYARSGSTKGITINKYTTYSPTTGISIVTYSYTIHK